MRYHKISKADIANGPGVRVVLWVSGCEHHCEGCHNPETWSLYSGKLFDEKAKQELFESLNKPYIQGLTISGGDPLHPLNRSHVIALVNELKDKFPSKDIWVYTGYYATKDTIRDLNCDVIVDGPFMKDLKDITLRWRGSSNQRIIDVKKSIQNDYQLVMYI